MRKLGEVAPGSKILAIESSRIENENVINDLRLNWFCKSTGRIAFFSISLNKSRSRKIKSDLVSI